MKENKEIEINLVELFKVFRKNLFLIILAPIIMGAIFFLVNQFLIDPTYQASTTLIVGQSANKNNAAAQNPTVNYNEVLTNQKLVTTYSQIAKSDSVVNKVIQDLGLNQNYTQVKGMFSVTGLKDTEIIVISSINESPEFAINLVNKVAEVLRDNIKEIYQIENVRILDTAKIGTTPRIGPKVSRNAVLGALLGLLLVLTILTLKFLFDRTLRNEDQLKDHYEYPILGSVPDTNPDDTKNREINLAAFNESFSMIRTNIAFSSINSELKVISVTSSQPSEGKSTITSTLARSIALNGNKVLLIDGDLRNPTVNKKTDVANRQGLVNYLVKNTPITEIIARDTQVANLDVLTTGPKPPNPAELLGSEKMKQFIEMIRPYYDYILIDCSPASLFSDARLLARLSDATIIVASMNEANLDLIESTIDSLEQVNANILGFILNKVDIVESKSYGYGYGYGYGKEKNRKHHK